MSDLEKDERKYKVYKLTCPNGKVYIGMTGQELKTRWKNGTSYKPNEILSFDIKKYGWNNFKHELLVGDLTKEEAELKEIEMIAFYDARNPEKGYNTYVGGSLGSHGTVVSDDSKKAMSDNAKKRDECLIPINQYDLNGNFVKRWDNYRELVLNYSKDTASTILSCCMRQEHYKTCLNYQWRFFNDCEDIKEYVFKSEKRKPMIEIDMDGNILNEYESRADCDKINNIRVSKIGKDNQYSIYGSGERLFMYKEDLSHKDEYLLYAKNIISHRHNSKPIIAINISNNNVYNFSSVKECMNNLNIGRREILKVIRGQRDSYRGYLFRYA